MVIVLGASGYIGNAYCKYFESNGISFRGLSRKDVNYTDETLLLKFLKEVQPDFLINAAGFTGKPNVDACEDRQAECLFANAMLPGIVQEACREAQVPWGHISSGCIFSGSKNGAKGFSELDAPNFSFHQNNCSFYSGTKALGEGALGYSELDEGGAPQRYQASEADCYIWRMRMPFDHHDNSRNYLTKLIRYRKLLDVTNSLSQVQEFIRATFECWEKRLPLGIYNVTNPGKVTTREVVDLISKAGVCNKNYEFYKNEEEFMIKAARARRSSCVLDASKLLNAGIHMTEVHEAIEKALKAWITE